MDDWTFFCSVSPEWRKQGTLSILTAVATPEQRDKQASSSVLFNQVMEEEEQAS